MATSNKYIYSVWRRKRSTAVVKLYSKWKGNMTVKAPKTEKTLKDFFGGNEYLYEDSLYPFFVVDESLLKKVDCEITVRWGWMRWQAEAIRLAFARALIELSPDFRTQLKPYGLLARDSRRKERKKPGLKKARKSPQWSKR